METGAHLRADIEPVTAILPGSVQNSLLQSGVLEDWHFGLQSRDCEWVEHRHWVYESTLPADYFPADERLFLCADGLDYSGWVLLDGEEIGTFKGALVPHEWEIPALDTSVEHRLQIVFDIPPEEQGQVGFTLQSRFFKPRYNFSWDWCPRFVPIGIWDELRVETGSQRAVRLANLTTELADDNATGTVNFQFDFQPDLLAVTPSVEVQILDGATVLARQDFTLAKGENNFSMESFAVEPWWPNGAGNSKLYTASIVARAGEKVLWEKQQNIGFKRIEWQACEGAPDGAEPWICHVNGQPTFLQGANWTPIKMNYHDTSRADYAEVLGLYREMGANLLRIWGGAFLEKSDFYELCDELGILVWQEFPLSSSGIDNWPPEDESAIETLKEIAVSYVRRRRSHVSLLLWCGGNELQGAFDGGKVGIGLPVTNNHPCIAMLKSVVEAHDPGRRFLPASSSGPRFMANAADFGKGLHHDVHGPWALGDNETMEEWQEYWDGDDSLFRSETGVPGASSLALIKKYAASEAVWPLSTPLWLHSSSWWTQHNRFGAVGDGLTDDEALARYVEETQQQQAQAIGIAAAACKARFPRCGGFLIWMGHDCFPCLSNTSVIDFDRNFKPAGLALREVFRS